MIRASWTRSNINKQVQRIVRMFRWGVSQELVRPSVAQALRDVQCDSPGLSDTGGSQIMVPDGGPKDEPIEG